MHPRSLALCVAFVLLALSSAGCVLSPHHDPDLSKLALPPDFAIEFYVDGEPAAAEPLQRSARYVLDTSRKLRVVTGPDAATRTFPPTVEAIAPRDYDALYQHVRRFNLLAEPGDRPGPGKEAAAPARYLVSITAHGRRHRYSTTAAQSPPTAELLAKLAGLAGVAPPLDGAP